jgi:hypothetical protein
MTGEIHSMVVKAGIKALKKLKKKDRDKLLKGVPTPDESMEWVYKFPTFRTEMEDRAMRLIERAVKSDDFLEKIKKFE